MQPKLQFAWFEEQYPEFRSDENGRPLPGISHHEFMRYYMLGVDIGHQWLVGPFQFALIIGVWAGVGTNVPSDLLIEPEFRDFNAGSSRYTRFIFGLNWNIVRVGFAF